MKKSWYEIASTAVFFNIFQIKIADHNKSPLISQCITHESERVILVATKIIEKISLNKSGQESVKIIHPSAPYFF